MITFVGASWVRERSDDPAVRILDPRRPMKYLSGHLKNAVNLPVFKAFDDNNKSLPVDKLAEWIGTAGLDDERIPLIYDSFDGQNGAMLAWILQYLGRSDVHMLSVFFERWARDNHEVFYKPVEVPPEIFTARPKPEIRATADDIRNYPDAKLIDFRSREEYLGESDLDLKPGHIPGAVNIVWRELVAPDEVLAPAEGIRSLLASSGVRPSDPIVSY